LGALMLIYHALIVLHHLQKYLFSVGPIHQQSVRNSQA
jgi:hypothetical protein